MTDIAFLFHVLLLFKNIPLEPNKVLYSTQDLKTHFQRGSVSFEMKFKL